MIISRTRGESMGFNIKIVLTGLVVAIFVLVGVNTFAKKEKGIRTMLQDFNTGKQSGYSCCGGGGYGGCGAASGSWKQFFGYQSE